MLNDSSSSHKLSQKYDESRDSVRFYVDGTEKKAVQMVPDWNNTQTIKDWRGPAVRPNGRHIIFTAPTDGYVTVYDCYNTSDYYLEVNGISAYHKCVYTNSSNGFFMIAKGDTIVFYGCGDDTIRNYHSYTAITFIPGKITEN